MEKTNLIRTARAKHSVQIYHLGGLLRLCIGVVLGALCVWAERRAYLPPILSPLFLLEHLGSPIIGLCLTQSAVIPLLFLSGLFRPSYWYTGKLWCFAFSLVQGASLGHLSERSPHPAAVVGAVVLLVLMFCLLRRADTLAAGGVTKQAEGASLPPLAYLSRALQLWGALMLLCGIYNILILFC